MKIKIRVEDTKLEATFAVDEKADTVYDLKEMIAKINFGPSIKEQRLEFVKNGVLKRLKNSHFINHYMVEEGSVIVLKYMSVSSSSSNSSSPSASDGESCY